MIRDPSPSIKGRNPPLQALLQKRPDAWRRGHHAESVRYNNIMRERQLGVNCLRNHCINSEPLLLSDVAVIPAFGPHLSKDNNISYPAMARWPPLKSVIVGNTIDELSTQGGRGSLLVNSSGGVHIVNFLVRVASI